MYVTTAALICWRLSVVLTRYLDVGNGEFRGGAPGPAPVGPGYAAQPAYAAQPGYGATATHP